jgi:hypothetical protein
MRKSLENRVRTRAANCCEYYHLPQEVYRFKFPIDHILAKQHGGETKSSNLALACSRCNAHKGPNLAGIDPETGRMVRLFNPRGDQWRAHFTWEGPKLRGLSGIGRATIVVLAINESGNVAVRQTLIDEGVFPKD